MTGATEHSYFQAKGKKAFPNLIKKLNVQFPPARILFLIFIYIVSLFQESQNNGFPQILQKKKKKNVLTTKERTGLAGQELRRGTRSGEQGGSGRQGWQCPGRGQLRSSPLLCRQPQGLASVCSFRLFKR